MVQATSHVVSQAATAGASPATVRPSFRRPSGDSRNSARGSPDRTGLCRRGAQSGPDPYSRPGSHNWCRYSDRTFGPARPCAARPYPRYAGSQRQYAGRHVRHDRPGRRCCRRDRRDSLCCAIYARSPSYTRRTLWRRCAGIQRSRRPRRHPFIRQDVADIVDEAEAHGRNIAARHAAIGSVGSANNHILWHTRQVRTDRQGSKTPGGRRRPALRRVCRRQCGWRRRLQVVWHRREWRPACPKPDPVGRPRRPAGFGAEPERLQP